MSLYTIYDQITGKVVESGSTNNPIIVNLKAERANIKSITREGNTLKVKLHTGEEVVVNNFYNEEHTNKLVVEDSNGLFYEVDASTFGDGAELIEIEYLQIEDISGYLYKDPSFFADMSPALKLGGLAAGALAVGLAVDSGSSSSDSESKPLTAKESLEKAIKDAQSEADKMNGSGKSDLIDEISQAESVLNNPNSTDQDFKDAETVLKDAVEIAKAIELKEAEAEAEAAVENAESAYQIAKDKIALIDANKDGLISSNENEALLEALKAIEQAEKEKAEAQILVSDFAEKTGDTSLQKKLDDLIDLAKPFITDSNNDGIADVDQNKLDVAEQAVKHAEELYRAAEKAIKFVDADNNGSIKKSEQDLVIQVIQDAADAKKAAQDLVSGLSPNSDSVVGSAEKALNDRLNKLETLNPPAITDSNGDGVADSDYKKLAEAETAVTRTEVEYAKAKEMLSNANEDKSITSVEHQLLGEAFAVVKEFKDVAVILVNDLPEGSAKQTLEDKLKQIIDLKVPEINKYDFETDTLEAAKSAVENAKKAHQDAINVIKNYDKDNNGVISDEEQKTVTDAIKKVLDAKVVAEESVSKLKDSVEKVKLEEELKLVDLNKFYDALKAVDAAEKAYTDAEKAINSVDENNNGLVSKSEQDKVITAIQLAETAKKAAQVLVVGLSSNPESVISSAEKDLYDRLAKLETLTPPAVTDSNNDDIKDIDADLLKPVEEAVLKAESLFKSAIEKIENVDADKNGSVSTLEQKPVLDAVQLAETAKKEASKLVGDLPSGNAKDDFESRLNELVELKVPAITDGNDDGIAVNDAAKLTAAIEAVKKAELAYKKAEDAVQNIDSNKNGSVTAAERQNVIDVIGTAKKEKDAAEELVKALTEGTAKSDLNNRLDKLVTLQAPAITDSDSDGIADDTTSQQALITSEAKVKAAEVAYKKAQDAIKAIDEDNNGSISPEERQKVLDAIEYAKVEKDAATKHVAELAAGSAKQGLLDRLNKLVELKAPEITDSNGDGIADVDASKLDEAEKAVLKAEQDYAKAIQVIAESQKNGLISGEEFKLMSEVLDVLHKSQEFAYKLVNDLAQGSAKVDLLGRLNNLSGLKLPDITDLNGDGIADTAEAKAQLEATEKAVKDAEDAYKKAEQAIDAIDADKNGSVTQEEQDIVSNAISDAKNAKVEAEKLVEKLPLGSAKDDLEDRLEHLSTLKVPSVTDTNGDGIADEDEAKLIDAQKAVKAAEDAYKEAQDAIKNVDLNKDGVVSKTESEVVEGAISDAVNLKEKAQSSVHDLASGSAQDALQTALDKLTTLVPPVVTDFNDNGIADSDEDKYTAAKAAVDTAKTKHDEALDAISTANADKLITSAEHQKIGDAIEVAKLAKNTAEQLVNGLLDGKAKSDLLEILKTLTELTTPPITDYNGDGIADANEQQLKDAEAAVKKAEDAFANAKKQIDLVLSDELVTTAEQTIITEALDDLNNAKVTAKALVDNLPDGSDAYKRLHGRLDELNGLQVPGVNDVNNDGIDDNDDTLRELLVDAEKDVEEAQNAYDAAIEAIKNVDVNKNGLISPSEQNAVIEAIQKAEKAKDTAEKSVEKLPESTAKKDLEDQLSKLTELTVPEITDTNDDGISVENSEKLKLVANAVSKAEKAYEEAFEAIKEIKKIIELGGQPSDVQISAVVSQVKHANQLKDTASEHVNSLSDGDTKKGLQDRLDKLTTLTIPNVADSDGDGINDDQDSQDALTKAKVAVKAAEDAYKKAQEALKVIDENNDGLISPSERQKALDEVEKANKAKKEAIKLIEGDESNQIKGLSDGSAKVDLNARIDKLVELKVPSVSKEYDDLSIAVELASKKYDEVENEIDEAKKGGIVTSEEHKKILGLFNEAKALKLNVQNILDKLGNTLPSESQKKVNELAELAKKVEDSIPDISTIYVFDDVNSNGSSEMEWIQNGDSTNDKTPIIVLSAVDENAELNINLISKTLTEPKSLSPTYNEEDKTWIINIPSDLDLKDGEYTITVNNELKTTFNLDTTITQPGIKLPAFVSEDQSWVADTKVIVSNIDSDATWFYSLNNGATWKQGDSSYSFNLPDGSYAAGSISVKAVDHVGNESIVVSNQDISVDMQPLGPITAVLVEDTGVDVLDGITNNNQIELLNVGPFATVYYNISDKGWIKVEATDGRYLVQLPDGKFDASNLSFKQVNHTNVETSSTLDKIITIDTTAPEKLVTALKNDTGVSKVDGITKDGLIELTNIELNSQVFYSIKQEKGEPIWIQVIPTISDGKYFIELPVGKNQKESVLFKVVDVAGNETRSTLSQDITVDVDIPNAPKFDLKSLITNNANSVITGTAADDVAYVEVTVNGKKYTVNVEKGKWSLDLSTKLDITDGQYVIDAVAIDFAGNISTQSPAFVLNIDTVAPDKPSINTLENISSAQRYLGVDIKGKSEPNSTITVKWADENGKIIVNANGDPKYIGTAVADENGHWIVYFEESNLPPIPSANSQKYFVIADAQDLAGNISESVKESTSLVKGQSVAIKPITGDNIINIAEKEKVTLRVEGALGDKSAGQSKIYVRVKDSGGEYLNIDTDGSNKIADINGSVENGLWYVDLKNSEFLAGLKEGVTYTVEVWDSLSTVLSKDLLAVQKFTVDYTSPSKPTDIEVLNLNYSDLDGVVKLEGYDAKNQPIISGIGGVPDSKVTIKDGDVTVGETIVNKDGLWELILTTQLTKPIEQLSVNVGDKTTLVSLQQLPYTSDSLPTIQGKGAEVGNIITIKSNGNIVGKAVVDVNGKWSTELSTVLPEGQNNLTVIETDKAGNPSPEASLTINVDTIAPSISIDKIAGDDILDLVEAKSDLLITGKVSEQNIDTLTLSLGGKTYTATVKDGSWSANIPSSELTQFSNTEYTVKLTAKDKAGNTSEVTRDLVLDFSQTIELKESDYKAVVVKDQDSKGNEISIQKIEYPVAKGQLQLANKDLTVDLVSPVAKIYSSGQEVVWSLEKVGTNSILVGRIKSDDKSQEVITIEMSNKGEYAVTLHKGLDHSIQETETITIPFKYSDGALSSINVVVADDAPSAEVAMSVSLIKAGTVEGDLVTSFGMDGGYIQSVTIEGNQYTYNIQKNTIQQIGDSKVVVAYSYSPDTHILNVTTIHGNTVKVDVLTGHYEVTANGISVTEAQNVDPTASLGNKGGLLGTANVNVAGLIDLSSTQAYTVSDPNNNITQVVIENAALLNLDLGSVYSYSKQLADEFGFNIKLIPAVLVTPARITITSKDGGVMDVSKLNEFLGTVSTMSGLGQVLDVKLLAGESIKVTDSSGKSGSDTTVNLADVGVLSGIGKLVEISKSGIIQHGDADNKVVNDELVGDKSNLSLDDRLYGYAGDDKLYGLNGDDILRGGQGNDTLIGGLGKDTLIGGTGNDILRGDSHVTSETSRATDIFKWELGDEKSEVNQIGVTKDTIVDFDISSLREGGDILDLAGLLKGEGRIGSNTGNLTNYLHFVLVDGHTEIHISTDGAFIGGYQSSYVNKVDQIIVLENVDLVTGSNGDQAIIEKLLSTGKLVVDSLDAKTENLTDQQINLSAVIVDGDGDKASTQVSVDTKDIPDQNFNPNNVAPETSVKVESILGLINLDLLGLNVSDQVLAAYDADNNLQSVVVKYQPILSVSLTPMEFAANQALAAELGLKFTVKNDDGVLGLIAPSSQIEITSATSAPINNLVINEFLASVKLVAQEGFLLTSDVLKLDVINLISITATDTQGASTSSTVGKLLGVNLLNLDTFNSVNQSIIEDDSNPSTKVLGTSGHDRIYAYDGDDEIRAGAGDDIIRGGAGNDIIYGEAGNDLMIGGSGDDTYYGGADRDMVLFELLSEDFSSLKNSTGGNGFDTWSDFKVGDVSKVADADLININALLDGNQNAGNITEYLSVKVENNNVTLVIDRDGKGNTYEKANLLKLENAKTNEVFANKTEDEILKVLLDNNQIIF